MPRRCSLPTLEATFEQGATRLLDRQAHERWDSNRLGHGHDEVHQRPEWHAVVGIDALGQHGPAVGCRFLVLNRPGREFDVDEPLASAVLALADQPWNEYRHRRGGHQIDGCTDRHTRPRRNTLAQNGTGRPPRFFSADRAGRKLDICQHLAGVGFGARHDIGHRNAHGPGRDDRDSRADHDARARFGLLREHRTRRTASFL